MGKLLQARSLVTMRKYSALALLSLVLTIAVDGAALAEKGFWSETRARIGDAGNSDVMACVDSAWDPAKKKDANETLTLCSKVIVDEKHSDQSRAIAYSTAGDAYAEIGEDKKAIEYQTKAIELNKTNGWAFISRGDAYKKLGAVEKSITEYKTAASLHELYQTKAYFRLAEIYNGLSEYDLSIAYLDKALEVAPMDHQKAAIYKERGDVLAKKGKSSRAQESFAKAIELEARGK